MAAVTTFSRTASNNNSAAPDGWPEGQSAASVNNCARELMKGIVDEATNNACKVLASVAGANTITGTLTPDLAAYSPGMLVVATPAVTNTGATTLNIDGLGAIAVQNIDGTACVGGELVAGIPALLLLNSGATAWIIANPANVQLLSLNIQGGNYTLVANDRSRQIRYSGAGTQTITLPSSILSIGSVVQLCNAGSGSITISAAGTLSWFNGGGSILAGNRTLAVGGIASLLQTSATTWDVSGVGIS